MAGTLPLWSLPPQIPTVSEMFCWRQECQKEFWLLDICYPSSSKSTFDCTYLCEMPLQSLIPPSRDFESGPQHFQGSLISALLPDDFSALFEGVNVTRAQMTITDDGPLLPGIYLWCCVETWPSHLLLRLKY